MSALRPVEWNLIDLLDSPWSRVPGPCHRMESDRSFGLSVVARAGSMSQNGIRSIFWTLRGRACRVHVTEWNQIDLLDSPWSRVPGPCHRMESDRSFGLSVVARAGSMSQNGIRSIFWTLRGRACRVHIAEWNQIDLLDSPWSRVPGPCHRMESDRSFGLRGRACRVHITEWNQIDLLDSPWSRVPGPYHRMESDRSFGLSVVARAGSMSQNGIRSIFWTLRGRACRVHVAEWNQIDLLDSPWSRVPGPCRRMESDRSFGLSVVARAGSKRIQTKLCDNYNVSLLSQQNLVNFLLSNLQNKFP